MAAASVRRIFVSVSIYGEKGLSEIKKMDQSTKENPGKILLSRAFWPKNHSYDNTGTLKARKTNRLFLQNSKFGSKMKRSKNISKTILISH